MVGKEIAFKLSHLHSLKWVFEIKKKTRSLLFISTRPSVRRESYYIVGDQLLNSRWSLIRCTSEFLLTLSNQNPRIIVIS